MIQTDTKHSYSWIFLNLVLRLTWKVDYFAYQKIDAWGNINRYFDHSDAKSGSEIID